MQWKSKVGPLMAIVIVAVVVSLGYVLGKNISYAYTENNNPNTGVFDYIKIENTDIPINYVLENGAKSLKELCGKDTGICDGEVGVINIERTDTKLYVYANFDNPDDVASTYFKIGNKKIGSFVYLDKFELINNQYLLVTEPNSYNDNYIIHIYDYTGKELMSYDSTNINSEYEIEDNILYFYHCNGADTIASEDETLVRVSLYRVNLLNNLNKIEESYEYQKCA